jgi:sortase A
MCVGKMKQKKQAKSKKRHIKHPWADVRTLVIKIFFTLGLLASIGLAIYPFVVNSLNQKIGQATYALYQRKNSKLTKEKLAELNEARAVAAKNLAYKLGDPFSKESLEEAREAVKVPEPIKFYEPHVIGALYLPKIHESMPIFDSTANEFISHGAGWMVNTSQPFGGVNNHAVLSSHRGLPEARLFTDLPKYKKGDVFILLVNNDYHAYKVSEIHVVEPSDTSKIKPVANKDLVSLLTCTPYGLNTHRLIVRGERTPFTAKMLEDIAGISKHKKRQEFLMATLVVALVAACIWYIARSIAMFLHRFTYYRVAVRMHEDATDEPLQNVTYQLYTADGRKEIILNDAPVILTPDESGLLQINKELPGRNYRLKPVTADDTVPPLKLWVKRYKDDTFSLKAYGRRKCKRLRNVTVNGIPHLWFGTADVSS